MTDKPSLSLVFNPADTLLPVPAADLREAWGEIRASVQKIADKCDEDWIAEDVFHELVCGNAYLWATPDRTGYAVLRLLANAYSRDLFIWIANIGTRPEGAAHYMPQFMEIARENNCKRVIWESPRPYDKIFTTARKTYSYSLDVGS